MKNPEAPCLPIILSLSAFRTKYFCPSRRSPVPRRASCKHVTLVKHKILIFLTNWANDFPAATASSTEIFNSIFNCTKTLLAYIECFTFSPNGPIKTENGSFANVPGPNQVVSYYIVPRHIFNELYFFKKSVEKIYHNWKYKKREKKTENKSSPSESFH